MAHDRTRPDTGRVRRLPDGGDRRSIQVSVQRTLEKVFETALRSRPGLFARNEDWWDARLYDPESDRGGRTPLRCPLASDEAGTRGYALCSGRAEWDTDTFLPDGSIEVRELTASDPAASAALWENLLSRDLATEIKAALRPADDPLLFQLADSRRLRPRVADGLWVRLVDLPAALSARGYAAPAGPGPRGP
jgi:predicted acetyltransferase